MKILTSIFAAALLGATADAQTNLFISLTNSDGVLITNAEVIKILPNKLYYRTDSGGGVVRLDALPPDFQRLAGYNPSNAAAADAAEKRVAMIQRAAAQRQVQAEQLLAVKKSFAQGARTISGKIIQKIPEGLLVDSGREDIDQVGHTDVEFDQQGNMSTSTTATVQEGDAAGSVCLGLVLLEDHPRYNHLVDDNVVVILAYPDGQFSYKTVSGGQKTIRKFTTDFNKAFSHQK